MKIRETIHRKVAVLEIKGKLMGPPGTNMLVENIEKLLSEGVTRIVLNMKHVNWINSLGLGAIVKCITIVRNSEGTLYLSELGEKVHSLFVMSQLIQIVKIFENVNTAIEELNNQ